MSELRLAGELKGPGFCSHMGSKYFGEKCNEADNCLQIWPHCATDMRMGLLNVGFPDRDIAAIEFLAKKKRGRGLVAVSGESHSGMSTTIQDFLPSLNQSKKIAAVEEPMERVLKWDIIPHQICEPDNGRLKGDCQQHIELFNRSGESEVVFIGKERI